MGYSEDFIPDGMNAFERNVKRIGDCIIAGVLLLTSNPQLNFQQLSNNFLSFMRVLYLSFVLL